MRTRPARGPGMALALRCRPPYSFCPDAAAYYPVANLQIAAAAFDRNDYQPLTPDSPEHPASLAIAI